MKKIKNILSGKNYFNDNYVYRYINKFKNNISIYKNYDTDIQNFDFVILALPTNFNNKLNSFDTSVLEDTSTKLLSLGFKGSIIIKSTIPIGFTDKLKDKLKYKKIFFSPEFLREGHELYDNLHPDRFICGSRSSGAKTYMNIIKNIINYKPAKFIFMSNSEAEATKLFSNSFLANRVAFFNELDTFALENNLSTKNIINGMCCDKRIGNYYNNPSFGYGGYCLPKDTKQLSSSFKSLKHPLIHSISLSNENRINYLAGHIKFMQPRVLGVYKIEMKKGSDNSRESSILNLILKLKNEIRIIVFDKNLIKNATYDFELINNFKKFGAMSDLIITNRIDKNILQYKNKLFSPDIFHNN